VEAPAAPAQVPASEPRQRWRLVVSRTANAPRLTQRELSEAWEAAFRQSGVPIALGTGSSARPRIAFGAPLPVGIAAEAELIDLYLTERWPRWRLRDAIEPSLPDGWSVRDLSDVWLGGPALSGTVAAGDYRITVEGADAAEIVDGARRLLDAAAIPRQRDKGGGPVEYDLRPLLADLTLADAGPPVVIRSRTRFHATLGTGRPDEVVAALATVVGRPLTTSAIVRERLLLADELDDGPSSVH
jgi:radical SAM-linked protein